MGAYSSWAFGLAFTHHIIVRVAGYYAYKHYNFSDYLLLGDDIVINDKKVATIYERLITKTLGVGISSEKSLISNSAFEFAKRFFIDGIEVTHLKLTQLVEVSNPLTVVASVLVDLAKTKVGGYSVTTGAVKRLLSIVSNNSLASRCSSQSIIIQAMIIAMSYNVD